MHKASREKIREHTDISYDDIFEFIALNFPGMKIAHAKTMDYGDKGFTDGVHNTIQYIQLSKDSGEYVNAVDKTYNYGFENSDKLPFD
jgi:hypothetical protein